MGISRTLGLRLVGGKGADAVGSVVVDGCEDVGVVGVDVSADPVAGDGDGVAVADSEEFSGTSTVSNCRLGLSIVVLGWHKAVIFL